MSIAFWITAGLLAVVALVGGITKTFVPKQKLAAAPGGQWTANASTGFVKTLGVLEILAAFGLILPAVTGIAPVLTPITAICWVLLMIGALITHYRNEGVSPVMLLNVTYLSLAVFVAFAAA
ncbi:DoxX family protein [Actinoplanes sp. HUAS TT8]|uniref:DoxX family protein n=1 Tax=Actinoplanes sp. HUAS TT8 TaxID=3447453 RepID=UPI003F51F360